MSPHPARALAGPPAILLTLLLCLPWAIPARAAPSASPVGVWATEGEKSHVQIEACGDTLCGSIIWLKEPLTDQGKEKTDINNPDPALRERKILGLALLSGFVPEKDDPNMWDQGKIYNPEDGKTYSCKLTIVDGKTMKVRGYVGMPLLGKTQVWTRVE